MSFTHPELQSNCSQTMYDLSYSIANWNIFSHDQAPAPKSGIDLVLLFDLPDEVSLKRAEGRMCKGFMTNLN